MPFEFINQLFKSKTAKNLTEKCALPVCAYRAGRVNLRIPT